MKHTDWPKLQNGSDIRGVAIDGVEGEPANLNSAAAGRLGEAFAIWLKKRGHSAGTVAIGTDSRITGPELKQAFAGGLIRSGYKVADCGIASTPAMFMATIHPEVRAIGGVMITASHLPFNRNGLKFFTANGGFNKEEITELLEIASSEAAPESGVGGLLAKLDFISIYCAHLVEMIRSEVDHPRHYDTPLKGMKIIVDAGNGAGGFFAAKVLEPLGADTFGSQFLEPDGRFPNHVPNPEDPEAMASICNAVVREKADLGVIFDTDVDRAAMVDASGNGINRNDLIALISTIVLEEHPGSTIVTDSITSTGLNHFIESHLKGVHHRFKRGYKNVINEAIRLNNSGQDSWLAIETSGHAAMKENHFLDDGAYLVAKLLVKAAKLHQEGKALGDLIRGLERAVEAKEFRLKINTKDFKVYGEKVIQSLEEAVSKATGWEVESPNFEGLRVNCNNADEKGWFLLRLSLHDPVLPLNIESGQAGGVDRIATKLKGMLESFDALEGAW